MKIALVSIHPCRSPQAVPLACAFLKEVLLADPEISGSLQVELCDFFLEDDPADCARDVAGLRPDLVAFSVYVWSSDHALAIAAGLRLSCPSLVLCAGGAEPTANPARLLGAGVFDFLIRGEGEIPFLQAVRARPPVRRPPPRFRVRARQDERGGRRCWSSSAPRRRPPR